MAIKKFLVDLDLNNNQLVNATIENLSGAPSTATKQAGYIYWNTTDKTAYIYTGLSSPNEWKNLGSLYTHPVTGALNPTLTGANVLATLTINAEGHVTAASSRILTLSNLGYTGATDANNYVHPTFTGNTLSGAPLTGSVVISNVVVNGDGHVTGFSTRSLTAANVGAAATSHSHTINDITDVNASASELNLLKLAGLTSGWVLRATSATTAAWGKLLGSQITNDLNWVTIADGLTNATQTWSSTKIQSLIDDINTSVAGGLINKGGYNAATNTPKLSTTPIAGIKNGWTYVVTTAGNFFSEAVQVGDMLIASQDNPTTIAHWTTVNKNIPDIVDASTSAKGIIQLSTTAEVQTGTDALKAVTPAGLTSRTATTIRTGILSLATNAEGIAGTENTKAITAAVLKATLDASVGGYATNFGNGVLTSFNIAHGLNTTDVQVAIKEIATNEFVEMAYSTTSTSVVNISCNSIPSSNQYRVIIKK